MTNEREIENKGRLLVVDDSLLYGLNATKAAKNRGYDIDVAFDLKDAMDYLQARNYRGIITDLQFFEEGCKDDTNMDKINRQKARDEGKLLDLEKRLFTDFETKLKTDIKPNFELRKKIAYELVNEKNILEMQKLATIDSLFRSYELEKTLDRFPPMGYEVIKYAQEHDIPHVVVTSVGHGQHCLFALMQTGLATADIIGKHRGPQKAREYKDFQIPQLMEQYGLLIADELKAKGNVVLLENVVLVMKGLKKVPTYDFAIDMLEGRIDQTRPYKIE